LNLRSVELEQTVRRANLGSMQDNRDKSRVYLGCNFAVLGYLRFMLSVAKKRQANEYDLHFRGWRNRHSLFFND